jgi:DNA (cytosine-5)-methyltransferase 1
MKRRDIDLTYGSVCSGIEAASVAWHPLGWRAVWLAEIEPFPSALLAHHYPDVPNLGDMTKIARAVLLNEVAAPDVLVGGTPCQAYSVAGLREGLNDERGQLTLSYVRLFDAIDYVRGRAGRQPALCVWENVPGVLSDKTNAFGCLLAGLAGEDVALEPPGGGVGERWLCVWTHANSRVASPRRPIFRSGPTTPPSVRCRKCS